MITPLSPDAWPLERRCVTAARLGSLKYAALQLTLLREKGAAVLTDFKYRLLHRHHEASFLGGLSKLGISRDLPPAVIAARYHYLSNLIGGLGMEYIEESPRKVWLRYLAPASIFPGAGLFAVPPEAARAVFAGWHAYNGLSLGCARLGFTLTKVYQDGEPYDEGFFEEHDRELSPEERFRWRPVTTSPDFDPARAPVLDPAAWPAERLHRARRSYATGYVEDGIRTSLEMFGVQTTAKIVAIALRACAIQHYHELRDEFGDARGGAHGLAQFFAHLLEVTDEKPSWSVDGHRVALRHTPRTFAEGGVPAEILQALFAFPAMCARLHSARVRVTPVPSGMDGARRTEAWVIEDAPERLF